ncbi:dTDP-4-amino-4,6-dideoxygalactose transaminase [Peristeroidobacter agariperforans]|uniref:dTDP-4-amino-4,6-dideoxygalactose transaminase n=1 Tax=Peristeroidobacter agariperforans TaxID=268404 RepID=UPI00101C95DE|nr:dTDP-4-amino-4,6-dideoxygalactose transaminase [Peristeroidobacter agariperforans]
MAYRIPFNKPFVVGTELSYIGQCLEEAKLCGDGRFTKECQELMQREFSATQVLLTTSGTSALEMAAMLCELEPGDEVVMPSYTFVSTANAFVLRGAKPVFVDIRTDTKNIDEALIEAAITPRTRAIVPVHYAGVACEMDAINAIAARHDLRVVEDAAQGVDATYRGAYLGTLGDFGAYSFHETKNFVCGEGGALVTTRAEAIERAEIIREKGTNRSQFFRGQVDKYTWVDVGSSFLSSDILAAFLLAQLQNKQRITSLRKRVYETYARQLQRLEQRGLMSLPVVPDHCGTNYHMFYIVLESLEIRTRLIEHLRKAGILAVFHYVPLHTAPMGLGMGYRAGMLPLTESISDRLLRLPLYAGLSSEEQDSVISEIFAFFGVG